MNRLLLEYEIKRHGFTIPTFCEELGITISTYYSRMNGKSDWKLGEIKRIADVLHLENINPIFFAEEVS